MSNLSNGPLSCSPIRLKSRLSLDTLASRLKGQLYDGNVPATGWGSVNDDSSALRQTTKYRPSASAPLAAGAKNGLPKRLKARYYFDAADVKARKVLAALSVVNPDPREVHVFNAVDLILAETPTAGVYEGVFTTRNEKEIGQYVNDGFRRTFAAIDPSATFEMDSMDFAMESDFYMWLIHRYDGDQRLSSDLKLETVQSMSSKDGLARPTSLSSGAEMDRAELATYLLQNGGKLGPAQFVVYSKDLDLTLEIELFPDGSFQVVVGKSYYKDKHPREVIGPMLVDDAVYKVIPGVRSAYSNDSSWPTPARDTLLDKASDVLRDHAKKGAWKGSAATGPRAAFVVSELMDDAEPRWEVVGVFSTRAAAEAHTGGDTTGFEIEEWTLDDTSGI